MIDIDDYKKLLASNIKKERIARNISTDELSKLLNCSISSIRLMERGERGVTTENLIKISKIFNVSVDALMFSNKTEIVNVNELTDKERLSRKKETLNALLYNLSEGEIDFVIKTVKNLRTMKDLTDNKNIDY